MDIHSHKNIFIGGLILLALIAFVTIRNGGGDILQGRIIQGGEVDTEIAQRENELGLKPDLKAALEVISTEGDANVTVSATIENAGEGTILGNTPFQYTLYINDEEVFSNTDSYTSMDSGDAFSFQYPISKAIYGYPDTGTVRFVIDTKNAIEEANEDNNEVEVEYSLN